MLAEYRRCTRKDVATIGRNTRKTTEDGRIEKRGCTVLSLRNLTQSIFRDKFERGQISYKHGIRTGSFGEG